ncbi:MAG: ABC transporter permease [Candidatus Baldrarchaeia archaeon]
MTSKEPLEKAKTQKSVDASTTSLAVAWIRFKKSKLSLLSLFIVIFVILVAILAPLLAPYDPHDVSGFLQGKVRSPPSWEHPFGTDKYGADILSKVIYGARTALLVGLLATGVSTVLGILVGGIAGYYGGEIDSLLMRVTEAFLVIPYFLYILVLVKIFYMKLAAVMMSMPQLGTVVVGLVIGLFRWAEISRLTRSEFLRIKVKEFVVAARCIGASNFRIVFRHILPNALPSIIVASSLTLARAILTESSIRFLGFGDPSVISWGQMLMISVDVMKTDWWSVVFPGIALFITVIGFNLFGDALNEVLNPRLGE